MASVSNGLAKRSISLYRNPDPGDPSEVLGPRECGFSLGQRDHDLHIADGEEAGPAVDHALVPVLVNLIGQDDDVALLKSELAFVLWLKVVEGAAARLVQHLRRCRNKRHPEAKGGALSFMSNKTEKGRKTPHFS